MENASKALIIAGGILIAMLVISVGVYLFANYVKIGSSYEQTMEATEIQKFNVNFTKFEGREDITIQEIVTVVNFAKQYLQEKEIDIQTILSSKGDLRNLNNESLVELIKSNLNKKYKATISYSDNGIVKSIHFSEKI